MREKKERRPFFLFRTDAQEGYVPNRELFLYSTALAGQNATYNLVNQWIFYFCTNVLHIDSGHVGVITSVSRVWDACNDPIVGMLIDRRKHAPGQKLHPYLGKLPVVIGLLTFLMFVNFGLPERGSIAIFLIVYFAWDMVYSFQDTALWGTMSLISPHSEERGRVSQWLNIGVGIGGGSVGAIPMLMGIFNNLKLSEGWQFVIYGAVFGLGGELLSAFAAKTRERVEFEEPKEKTGMLRELASLRHNGMLLLLMLAQVVSFVGGAIPWIYFFKYCVSLNVAGRVISGETLQTVYGLLSGILGTFSVLFSAKIAGRVGGMRNVILIAKFFDITMRVLAYFVGYQTVGQLAVVLVLMNISSFFNNLVGIAQRSLLCDAVDYAEWKTGKRTEGISFSLQNLTNKLLDSLKLFFCGVVLDRLAFDGSLSVPDMQKASPAFIRAQWPIFMLLPALGSLFYLIPFLFIRYPASKKAQVEAELAARHAATLQAEETETGARP